MPSEFEVHWTESAQKDLQDHARFIAEDSIYQAGQFVDSIAKLTESLSLLPERGSKRKTSSGQLVRMVFDSTFSSHLVFYTIGQSPRLITVVRIIHTSQIQGPQSIKLGNS